MIKLLLIFSYVSIFSCITYGDIKFKYDMIDKEISPLLNNYYLKIPFNNDSTNYLEIVDISSSCSCISFKLGKRIYAPKESGVLDIEVNTSGKIGTLEQNIIIKTNSKRKSSIKIPIRLKIKPFATINPYLIFWRLNENNTSKTASIDLNLEFGDNISNIITDNDNFIVKLTQNSENKSNFEIKVTPKSTIEPSRAIISFLIKASDGTLKKHFIHAMIK